MSIRVCTRVGCGAEYAWDPKPGRPPRYCEACRAEIARPKRQVAPTTPRPVTVLPEQRPTTTSATLEAVQAKLTAAGRTDTVPGAVALRLAALLDAGGHSASGYAALARQLTASVEEACRGASLAGDPLAAIRDRRSRGA